MKKIYFAGSIRGSNEVKDLYPEIIRFLKNYGTVLTEHIWEQKTLEIQEQEISDEKIYHDDIAMLESCDIVIAEITAPSLGVGYEIAYAEAHHKKIIALFNQTSRTKPSAMLNGNPNITLIYYSHFEKLKEQLIRPLSR